MSEPLFLLLSLALIVGYLLLTAPGRRARPRSHELDRVARDADRAMEQNFKRGWRMIDKAAKRRR